MILVLTVIATVAAAVAAVAALIALVYASKLLGEARATTKALNETLRATGTLITRVEASTIYLGLIFSEAKAQRELDGLSRVASQVAEVATAMRVVVEADRAGKSAGWQQLQDQQRLLTSYIAGLPTLRLEKCQAMADNADPRYEDVGGVHLKATQELKEANGAARTRLETAEANATKQLAQMTASDR